jgi:hypothetical protein
LCQIDAGVLSIAYFEAGRRWPGRDADARLSYDIHSYVDVAPHWRRKAAASSFPICAATATRFSIATPRSGEQAAVGADMMALMDALGIQRAVFAGYRLGWPRGLRRRGAVAGARIGLVPCVNGYLIQDIANAMVPAAAGARGAAVVPVLFPARARPCRPCRQPARDRQILWRNGRRTGSSTMPASSRRSPSTIPITSMS